MARALVLNATYEPLCVVPIRRALVLVLKEKAEIVQAGEGQLRSAEHAFPVPSVIRLTYFVRVPYRARAALTRRGVFLRDDHECQYCGLAAENLDHVVPRSRGGAHVWENVVAACRRCNARKENKTPTEANMRLRRRPSAPKEWAWVLVALGRVAPEWEPYLQPSFAAG